MPVADELGYFLIGSGAVLIACDYLVGSGIVLLTKDKGEHLCFAGSKLYICLQGAAGIAVVVEGIAALAAFYCDGVGIGPVRADEAVKETVVACYLSTCKTQEALTVVGTCGILAAVYIDVLEYLVALKGDLSDELGVLEIELILLIVVFGCEFTEAEYRELSGLGGSVGDLCVPYLIGLAQGNVIGDLGFYFRILGGDDGISRTVAAFALVLVKRLAHGLP